MLDFESCQSIEKLVMDNEICGMAKRLIEGITPRSEPMGMGVLSDVIEKGANFLSHPNTLEHFRKEFYFPSMLIDRSATGEWEKEKKHSIVRAKEFIQKLLKKEPVYHLDGEKSRQLKEIMSTNAKKYGMEKLPELKTGEKALV
jgi:trimethylamine--corrinoid protein Co-methyltransferase